MTEKQKEAIDLLCWMYYGVDRQINRNQFFLLLDFVVGNPQPCEEDMYVAGEDLTTLQRYRPIRRKDGDATFSQEDDL